MTAQLLRPFHSRRLLFANDVDDVLQDILISIHKARHTYDGQRPYKPWVYAIAKFRLQDHLRTHYTDHLKSVPALSGCGYRSRTTPYCMCCNGTTCR